MFDHVRPAPPDPIFGLTEAFRKDSNAGKINLGVGVYQDDHGRTPIFDAVHRAEARLLDKELSKAYLPIDGTKRFTDLIASLVLGDALAVRAAVAHTPGGTGALRVAAELVRDLEPSAKVHLSNPTWANHRTIFERANLSLATYRYLDFERHSLATDALLEDLEKTGRNDVVVLHGTCHNPSGVDPSPDVWQAIARRLETTGAIPIIDFAYQGFGHSVDVDRQAIEIFADHLPEFLVCSSCSKNFGLYNERTGALMAVCSSASKTNAIASRIKSCIRPMYSNPPAHGAAIVAEILESADLRHSWSNELESMRLRIRSIRSQFVDGLDQRNVSLSSIGNEFMNHQLGMFSFTGLDREAVARLRADHSIYLVGSGRISVAGLNSGNLDQVCDSIAQVTRD